MMTITGSASDAILKAIACFDQIFSISFSLTSPRTAAAKAPATFEADIKMAGRYLAQLVVFN